MTVIVRLDFQDRKIDMKRFLILISMGLITILEVHGQEEQNYFISQTQTNQYFVKGVRFPIKFPLDYCSTELGNTYITKGENFIIVQILDEMEGSSGGVLIFKKSGEQVYYDVVQNERKKYYENYNCCVYVKELGGKLYFWDVQQPFGDYEKFEYKDYDCFEDSQTDPFMFMIPRYYIFEPSTGTVVTKILKNKCPTLIQNGKVICD
jgi:hypothetical protein